MYTLKKSHDTISNLFHEESYKTNAENINDENEELIQQMYKPYSKRNKKYINNKKKLQENKESSSDEEIESSSDEEIESSSDEENKESSSDEEIESSSDEESESNELPLHENSIYNYDNESYIVDNEKFLQKRFDDIQTEQKYAMNMCIYKCARNGYNPYLLFLMVYDESTKTYMFPKYQDIFHESKENSVEEIEELFINEYKKKLFDIFPPNTFENLDNFEIEEGPTNIYNDELYKGFYLHENSKNEITMVYDATRINIPFSKMKRYSWVSPYEIFVSKQVKITPISNEVHDILEEITQNNSNGKDFYHLKRVTDQSYVETPYILFMCIQKDASSLAFDLLNMNKKIIYENVIEKDDETYETILFPEIQHKELGNYTFFSSLPITQSELIKRYAVFIDLHTLYLEPDKNEKLMNIYSEDTNQYSAITFVENNVQLWCIKSPIFITEIPNDGYYALENKVTNNENFIENNDL